MKYTLLLSLVFGVVLSCKLSKTYIPDGKRFYKFNDTYSSTDTLFIRNFIMYGNADMGTLHDPWRRVRLNSDSLIHVFKTSISKIEAVNISVNDQIFNRVNNSYYSNPLLKYKKIDKEMLISFASNDTSVLSLIPVILFSFNASRWSGSGQFDTYPRLICHLNIAVFIVKNQEIIYFKQMRYVEKVDGEYHPYEFEDYHIPIPQEHWDGLVQEVMKEYIERLE